MPFESDSSLVLAGGPIVAVVGVVTSIGSPGDGGDVLTMGVWRRGTVRDIWWDSGSLEKGLPRARSSARSITALPVKCQKLSLRRVSLPGRGRSRVGDGVGAEGEGRRRTSLHPELAAVEFVSLQIRGEFCFVPGHWRYARIRDKVSASWVANQPRGAWKRSKWELRLERCDAVASNVDDVRGEGNAAAIRRAASAQGAVADLAGTEDDREELSRVLGLGDGAVHVQNRRERKAKGRGGSGSG